MGLLTDPSGLRGRPFQFLVKNHGGICAFLYLLSVVWYCLLAHDQINAGTYLSENALLPGLVALDSDVSRDVVHYVELLEAVLDREPDTLPTSWIRGTFTQMGIESYVHNFTLKHPLNRGLSYEGKNVYGIIRGGGSSNEAIVLSVPFRGKDSPYPSTKVSIALLLAIAHYFRKQKYWAKDIILLITQHELLGTQAWLEAYHGTSCGTKGVLEAGELEARGGSIQAALNLEIHSSRIERLEVKLLGLNGQLPNLDLVNLVHRICAKERVKHSFAGREKLHSLSPKEQWLYSLGTMTTMVLGQATGVPDGNHGLFHRFGIEAVTVESEEKVGAGHGVPMRSVGRVVEGVFRSINNLLERFHQSYFFYILADTDKFISIALYIVCIGAQAAPLLIKAFADQVSLRSLSDQKSPDYSYNVGGVFLAILYCFVLGLMAFHVPVFFSDLLRGIFSTRAAVLTGFVVLSVFGILTIEIFGHLHSLVTIRVRATDKNYLEPIYTRVTTQKAIVF
ncbi:glycosylphosphatidylinositol anchor attachment 1 protein isoform X2 [Cimex lectularius]|uniref:Glycosylphosphatidylinositol anchor attachment 1 protein n=1 Tax=Cimex lectularius TaxID=79782 RepID=A0A8I6SGM5_CIMLE|nr:glycosylphosphatidylinositol anchor attachment 1 protein isoform X2 [Cimex lectularius]